MRRVALGMLFGITVVQQLSSLPVLPLLWTALAVFLLGLGAVFIKSRRRGTACNVRFTWESLAVVVFSAGIGFCWAAIVGQHSLANVLSPALEGQDVVVEGFISSLPELPAAGKRGRARFEFVPDILEWQGKAQPLPGKLLLSWYQTSPVLQVGERWRLKVRLKRPHGFMNPGGFDYEATLFRKGIRAKGYVREPRKGQRQSHESGVPIQADRVNVRLAEASVNNYSVGQIREGLRARILSAAQDHPLRGIVLALAIGDRQQIAPPQWEILMRTGTNHLVAISGLHVGLVTGFVFFAMRRLWRLSATAVTYCPAPKAGALAALLAASVYALLAGFSVPTQRALVMVAVVMLALLVERQSRPATLLALAAILVLIIDPMAVMAAGFWLSFAAVGIILYGMSCRLAMRSLWWRWGRVQWVVGLGLLPALMLLFQKASLVSPLANLLAVPWVSLITVPLTLLGSIFLGLWPSLGEGLLALALWSLEGLWWWLEMLSQWSFAQWQQRAPPPWAVAVSLLGMVWLLAPRGMPARWVGATGILPLLFMSPALLPLGEAKLALLDVGQGLSAVVQTQNHVLVFDAGPRFNSGFNTGDAVVVPYLRAQGRGEIDTLVVSHADNDHIGGVKALLTLLPVKHILSSEPEKITNATATHCEAGQHWQWDEVNFTVLNPVGETSFTGSRQKTRLKGRQANNRSCVIHVQAGEHSVLLTGDIEAGAEREMIQRLGGQLRADVMVVPHHGSKTSSTVAFVAAVSPHIALFPVGYRNRYGFPKEDVVQRYQDRAVRIFDTASHGAVEIQLGAEDGLLSVDTYRQRAARFWNN